MQGHPAPQSTGEAGSVKDTFFGSLRSSSAASSASKYSLTGRESKVSRSHVTSVPGTPRCRLASALITLASIAKPSPPTNPSARQRSSTVSNTNLERLRLPENPAPSSQRVERYGRCPDASSTAPFSAVGGARLTSIEIANAVGAPFSAFAESPALSGCLYRKYQAA